MHTTIQAVFIGAVIGALSGIATVSLLDTLQESPDKLIAEYYAQEVAVSVSPHGLRKQMDKGILNFILIDLRSPEEYEREHIVGAINIPAYTDPDTSAYDDVERIVDSFRALPADRDIITYCYSIPCMTSRKIGNMLAEHGIYVKHLNVGWNEWRYDWTSWNHEHEWEKTQVEDYIVSGPEPGVPKVNHDSGACPIEGEFGC